MTATRAASEQDGGDQADPASQACLTGKGKMHCTDFTANRAKSSDWHSAPSRNQTSRTAPKPTKSLGACHLERSASKALSLVQVSSAESKDPEDAAVVNTASGNSHHLALGLLPSGRRGCRDSFWAGIPCISIDAVGSAGMFRLRAWDDGKHRRIEALRST